jgi:hypothetical protein
MESELVKIKSDNPAHPKGYYIQFRAKMKPEDVEYIENEEIKAEAAKTEIIEEAVQEKPAAPIKTKRKRK